MIYERNRGTIDAWIGEQPRFIVESETDTNEYERNGRNDEENLSICGLLGWHIKYVNATGKVGSQGNPQKTMQLPLFLWYIPEIKWSHLSYSNSSNPEEERMSSAV